MIAKRFAFAGWLNQQDRFLIKWIAQSGNAGLVGNRYGGLVDDLEVSDPKSENASPPFVRFPPTDRSPKRAGRTNLLDSMPISLDSGRLL